MVFQIAYQTLDLLHPKGYEQIDKMSISLVESGYEPEIFKSAFKDGWQNYDHSQAVGIEESSGEESEEESKKPDKKSEIKQNYDLIPESYWIN